MNNEGTETASVRVLTVVYSLGARTEGGLCQL
jgi:hypothetical protein